MQQVYFPSEGLQTSFSSVPDSNDIPKSTTKKTTATTDSTSTDNISQAKDFFQDNSTYIFIGLGLGVLLFVMTK